MSAVTGVPVLVRLILRRDRIRLAVWVIVPVMLATVSAVQVRSLYSTPQRLLSYVSTFGGNPALVMFAGPGYGFDRPTVGVVLVNELALWMAVICALMSVFLVGRYTRVEEDLERADLLRSCVVGRHASLASALLVVGTANMIVAGGVALTTAIAGYPVAGSLAMAFSFGAVGLVFAAATAVTAQIANAGRASLALGAGTVAFAFVLRGVGDIRWRALSWMTPFGWSLGVRAFAGERWWTLVGLVAATFGLTAAALALSVRRDLGSGLLSQRRGPAAAAAWTTRPLGLVFRLQRSTITGWTFGVFLTGLVYGWVGRDVERVLAENPDLAKVLAQLNGASLTDSYLATALRLMALVASGFAISSTLRNRSDEVAGFTEHMLSGGLSRNNWMFGHLVVTLGGVVVVVLGSGLGVGLGYAAAIHDPSQIARLILAAAVTLPSVLILVGVTACLFGLAPRAVGFAWAALAFLVMTTVFASILHLPSWLLQASPLRHTPAMPAEPARFIPLGGLGVIALGLVAIGMAGFQRRDLTTE